jgi:O-antigen/teichoic acid export membrane protein
MPRAGVLSAVRIAAAANAVGQGWALVLSLAMIPIYLRWMGLEAYGLLGIHITLTWAAAVLDVGLSATVNRELAQASVAPRRPAQLRDLVRTLECLVWPAALLLALAGWGLSGFLAGQWLKPVALTVEQTRLAIVLMTAAIAAHWPSGFYGGALAGMNRQVLLNALNICFGTLKALGVLVPLALVDSTVIVFFAWQLAVGVLHTLVLGVVVWRLLPADAAAPRPRSAELARVGAFTGAVAAIGLLSFVLMQIDRIVLSTLLPLDEFGYYALAIAMGTAVLRLILPMQAALYPRYSQLIASNGEAELTRLYHNSSQVVAVLTIPLVAVLAVFAHDVIRVWTGDAGVAAASATIMAVLAVGYGLNGLMFLPYALQLAHGNVRRVLLLLGVLAALAVPATWYAGQRFGGLGAAGVWTVLNCVYVAVGIPWMHARYLRGELGAWLRRDLLPVLVVSIACVALARWWVPRVPEGIAGAAVLALIGVAVWVPAALAVRYPRALAAQFLRSVRGAGGADRAPGL